MQAYIDSICNRKQPPAAAAVRPTRSALLLQSHQQARRHELDERRAAEAALQAGVRQRPAHSQPPRQHPFTPSAGSTTTPPVQQLPQTAHAFSVSTPVRPTEGTSLSRSRGPTAATQPAPAAWPRQTYNTLGLPPTPAAQRQRHTMRMWTPAAQRTFSREGRVEGATVWEEGDASAVAAVASPWHPLFSASPSPVSSPGFDARSGTPKYRDNVRQGEGDGEANVTVRAAHRSPVPRALPFRGEVNGHYNVGDDGANGIGGSVENGSKSGDWLRPRNVSETPRRVKENSTGQVLSSSATLQLHASPTATWAAWNPQSAQSRGGSTTTRTVAQEGDTPVAHMNAGPSNERHVFAEVPQNVFGGAHRVPPPPIKAAAANASVRTTQEGTAKPTTQNIAVAEYHANISTKQSTTPPLSSQLRNFTPAPKTNSFTSKNAVMNAKSLRRDAWSFTFPTLSATHQHPQASRDDASPSLRDLHNALYAYLQRRSSPFSSSGAASSDRAEGEHAGAAAVSGTALSDLRVTLKAWVSTKEVYERLFKERAAMGVTVAGSEKGQTRDNQQPVGRTQRDVKDAARAYLYSQRDAEASR